MKYTKILLIVIAALIAAGCGRQPGKADPNAAWLDMKCVCDAGKQLDDGWVVIYIEKNADTFDVKLEHTQSKQELKIKDGRRQTDLRFYQGEGGIWLPAAAGNGEDLHKMNHAHFKRLVEQYPQFRGVE